MRYIVENGWRDRLKDSYIEGERKEHLKGTVSPDILFILEV
jgi:hypothetical protein